VSLKSLAFSIILTSQCCKCFPHKKATATNTC